MNVVERLTDEAKTYVSSRNKLDQDWGFAPQYSFYPEYIRSETWHGLNSHCPGDIHKYRELVYVVHDEYELLYIGETEKTVLERFSTHISAPKQDRVGPWPLPSLPGERAPQKLGYWLRRREVRGSINFWVTILPTQYVFGLEKSPNELRVITKQFQDFLIDRLCPILNGGTAQKLSACYDRYVPWERKQMELDNLIVKEQCSDCEARKPRIAPG
jgi:hypothetical protein